MYTEKIYTSLMRIADNYSQFYDVLAFVFVICMLSECHLENKMTRFL